MAKPLQDILILGGGTAGWLTAGILAARHQTKIQANQLSITLCESPNIPTIGVGEGTWPTMPKTLQSLGIWMWGLFLLGLMLMMCIRFL